MMIQEIAYGGWGRNVRLLNGETELVITLEVGPRVLRAGFVGERNLFFEAADQLGGRGEKEWQIRGGHRFWTAPENEHSYALDNTPVSYRSLGDRGVEITGPAQEQLGWQKTLRVESDAAGRMTVTHRLQNIGSQPLDLTPWALTVMAPGGKALIPQPEPKLHQLDLPKGAAFAMEDFLPNRKLVLWKYTHLDDARFTLGQRLWVVRHDAAGSCTKLGLNYDGGWVGYQLGDTVFCKKIAFDPARVYPDGNCNFELFTNRDILELESLAPQELLMPAAVREHVEYWRILRAPGDLASPELAASFFAGL